MTSSNGNIFRFTGPLSGNSPGTGEFPSQRPVARNFDFFFDLWQNKRLSKQWWGCKFETQSRPLWHYCNEEAKPNKKNKCPYLEAFVCEILDSQRRWRPITPSMSCIWVSFQWFQAQSLQPFALCTPAAVVITRIGWTLTQGGRNEMTAILKLDLQCGDWFIKDPLEIASMDPVDN